MKRRIRSHGIAAVCAAPLVLTGVTLLVAQKPQAPAGEGERCGTIVGVVCAPDLWCDLQAGACKGADLDGVCMKPREQCADECAPVCGCDGKTYASDCERIRARAQKDHAESCKGMSRQSR